MGAERYRGTVEALGPVDSSALAVWVSAIPLSHWPQQRVGQLWPAMQTDLTWFGFGDVAAPLVVTILATWFPGCAADQLMLSVVMPGREIEPHTDSQPPHWICRVHVPLATNAESEFVVGGISHAMAVGNAYKVNTEAVHAVYNRGATPRTHFMWDVHANH